MNSKQLNQPWPVMVIACRIEQGQEHVLCHAACMSLQALHVRGTHANSLANRNK